MNALLADAVSNPEERARHLAASTSPPDENVAIALEAAATGVARRGAPDQGAQLAELSARFTADHDAGASRRRRLTAADFHGRAGGSKRETELLRELESAEAACRLGKVPERVDRQTLVPVFEAGLSERAEALPRLVEQADL